MAKRNLSCRADIPGDALRQRRDLYALAIGLELFNLAGGKLAANTSFGSLLPLSLSHPHYLLLAAWVGFFYFWFRFWLISEARPFADFIEDARWQAGDSAAIRRIAVSLVDVREDKREAAVQRLSERGGMVPKIVKIGRVPTLSLVALKPNRGSDLRLTAGGDRVEIPKNLRRSFWWAWMRAIPAAAIRERTFTDYTLPHLVALVTVLHGFWRGVITPLVEMRAF